MSEKYTFHSQIDFMNFCTKFSHFKEKYTLREKIQRCSDQGQWRAVRFMTDSGVRCTGDGQLCKQLMMTNDETNNGSTIDNIQL